MATVLDNIGIVENADLAKMEGSKSIKTKPTTFTGTKNYYNEQLNMGLEKESTVVELTDEEREKLIQKVEKLKRMETELSAREIASRVHFGARGIPGAETCRGGEEGREATEGKGREGTTGRSRSGGTNAGYRGSFREGAPAAQDGALSGGYQEIYHTDQARWKENRPDTRGGIRNFWRAG